MSRPPDDAPTETDRTGDGDGYPRSDTDGPAANTHAAGESQTLTGLFRRPGGAAVLGVGFLVLVYALLILGNVLLGVLAATLLVGGYVTAVVALRLLAVLERIARARERAAEAEARLAERRLRTDRLESTADDRADHPAATDDERRTETDSEWAD
ncbi:hypothetical protein RYH80_12870 [Halobaculum sp. MBLA0147]|uniref:hypothetical protein n=1 Tax=Halobaculum sp. MBLA0147 TaxID=3079934 RepID=UPI0035232BE5